MSRRTGRWRVAAAVAVALVSVATLGCIDPLLGPEPNPDDARENFDILWREFDRYYSFFELKGIDWDSARAIYRPRIEPSTTGPQLLGIVSEMLDGLEDGHVNVFTSYGDYVYTGWFEGVPRSYFPHLVPGPIGGEPTTVPGGTVQYARAGYGIGYLHVPSFQVGTAGQIDIAFERLDSLDSMHGLILDLRNNGGGSDREARLAAGRFVDARHLYRTVRYRNGPEHDDFTAPIPSYVEPEGPRQFAGPVVVLTNRRTFSAAESFLLAVRTMPDVLVVGDTTGGGSGFPMYRELPNGWTYRLSRWIAYDTRGRPFEGVGLVPDETIQFDEEAAYDLILLRAIDWLYQELGPT